VRILLVEDDKSLLKVIKQQFVKQSYSVDTCLTGTAAEEFIRSADYDCIVCDRMLPGKEGTALVHDMRTRGDFTPVLFLTAKDATQDRVTGLDSGADDYLTKPFSFEELFARVRALIRRNIPDKHPILQLADLRLDPASKKVRRDTEEIRLSGKEYALLEYLLRNQGRILSRTQIISHVWDFNFTGGSNVVDVFIRYLRRKLDSGHTPKLIHTVRGRGYLLQEGDTGTAPGTAPPAIKKAPPQSSSAQTNEG
jgi:DNA-binding response OmpR family regulator